MHVHLDWEWELEIEFNPQELEHHYELHFFLGPVPSHPSQWRSDPTRILGPITSQAHGTTKEFHFLNGYIENKLEDDNVIKYLRDNLSWGAKRLYYDEKIEISRLMSLKVFVHGPDGATQLDDQTPSND